MCSSSEMSSSAKECKRVENWSVCNAFGLLTTIWHLRHSRSSSQVIPAFTWQYVNGGMLTCQSCASVNVHAKFGKPTWQSKKLGLLRVGNDPLQPNSTL